MDKNCYLAQVTWDIEDGLRRTDNAIIYATTYADAMSEVLEYYSDGDIYDIKLTWLSDMLFYIPTEDIARLKKFQEE